MAALSRAKDKRLSGPKERDFSIPQGDF